MNVKSLLLLNCVYRLFSACRVRLSGMGVQTWVEPGLQTDPAVALYPGAAQEGGVPRCHRVAGGLRRVRHKGPGRGGQTVGGAQVQASDELWQTQSSSQVNYFLTIFIPLNFIKKSFLLHPHVSTYRSLNKPGLTWPFLTSDMSCWKLRLYRSRRIICWTLFLICS